jgi:2-dehydro-3-deoxyglucarate aldolase/4-hydroxy-2-oxoheptanedioate aldolase
VRGNAVKRTLAAGGTAIGLMVFEFPTAGVARMAASAGADFVLWDTEHTGWSVETLKAMMAAARGSDIVPMARVQSTQYHLLSRPLDVGAMGLMIPMVESGEQARSIVAYAKYPPDGRRGVGLFYADDLEDDLPATIAKANREQLLIPQIETIAGVDSLDEIASVDGIDVLWVGPGDLTTSLGIPGEFTHPAYLEALDRVVAVAEGHGKTAGILATSIEQGKELLARGFRALVLGDSMLFAEALRASFAGLKA